MEKGSEIDLWELLAGGMNLFRRRRAVILTVFLSGLAFGAARHFLIPSEFASYCSNEYAVRSSVVTNEVLCDILNNIPSVRKQGQELHPGFRSLRNIKGRVSPVGEGKSRLKVAVETFDAGRMDSIVDAASEYVKSFYPFAREFGRYTSQQQALMVQVKKDLSECGSAGAGRDSTGCVGLLAKRQEIENNLHQYTIIEFLPLRPACIPVSNLRAGVLSLFGFSLLGLTVGFIVAFLTGRTAGNH